MVSLMAVILKMVFGTMVNLMKLVGKSLDLVQNHLIVEIQFGTVVNFLLENFTHF